MASFAAVRNLEVVRGDTLDGGVFSFLLLDVAGSPVDLTGATAVLDVRTHAASAAPVLALTEAAGLTLGGAAGTVTPSRTAAEMEAVPAGAYRYDLRTTIAGVVETWVSGAFVVHDRISQ